MLLLMLLRLLLLLQQPLLLLLLQQPLLLLLKLACYNKYWLRPYNPASVAALWLIHPNSMTAIAMRTTWRPSRKIDQLAAALEITRRFHSSRVILSARLASVSLLNNTKLILICLPANRQALSH